MEAFQSCKYIEHGLVLDHKNVIRACNIFNPGHEGRPVLYENYCGEKIDWNEFFAKKNALRKYSREGNCPPQCEGCIGFEYKEWDDENYVDYLLMTPWIECNSRCIYCTCHSDIDVKNNTKPYSVLALVKDMIEHNVLKKDGTMDFAGGEPTIYPEFKELLTTFLNNDFTKIVIHTNAILYSEEIARGIKEGKVNILVSIDAGSKEIHEKVKGVNTYDAVWNNMAKYAAFQNEDKVQIKTKFILYPGLNDSEEEIRIWLEKNAEIGIKAVVLDLDFNWICKNYNNISMELYNLIDYTYKEAEKLGLKVELYGSIFKLKTLVENKVDFNKAGF